MFRRYEEEQHREDLSVGVTARLQLAIPAPEPPKGSFNKEAAAHGQHIFNCKATCATCHVPPLFTEPGWPLHTAEETGIDDFQANRSPGNATGPRRCEGSSYG